MIQDNDEDKNGVLDNTEIPTWILAPENFYGRSNWQWKFRDELGHAWQHSQMDDDDHTATRAELAQYHLRTWVLLLPDNKDF